MRQLVPGRLRAALQPDSATRLEIPGDVLHESRRRVRVAAAIGAVAYGVFLLLELTRLVEASDLERRIDLAHDVIGVSICAVLLVATLVSWISDRSVLAAALVVEVLLAALISVAVMWAGFIRTDHVSTLTWVIPMIILFPLLVPAPPRTALVVSALCALMMPLGLWALTDQGLIETRASDYYATCVAGAVAVAIAYVGSRTIYGANRRAAAMRKVGSYELLEPLGQGGMGEVWKARHSFLARPAAVKLILPDKLRGALEEQEEVLRRFTREAQVTASLRSPHTVELFDFGTSDGGALYYAMELLDGMNAEHFVYRFGPLEPRRAVNWLRQACHSLGEAHARGLVHRDIKPANMFICRYGRDADFVKILDFGLTKPTTTSEVSLTASGIRMGTPSYMAPEQIFGLEAEPRTDLYALGCVAYWLLAGEKPFEGASAGELLQQHAQKPPPSLSAKAPQPLSARLEDLVMACLSKRPDDRPADADAMHEELGRCIDGAPWGDAEAQDWWAKNVKET